jgi:high-affinity nickel-transport protein
MVGTLALGLVLGMRHATDPDHVLAISTIVSRDPGIGRAVRIGVVWGFGHTLTVLGVGGLMLICGVTVPRRAAVTMDLIVALMLVGLGAASLRGRVVTPHGPPSPAEAALVSPIRPLLVGIVHGLAGSAGVTLLALATVANRGEAVVYLGLFGFGTVVGMMLVTIGIALPLACAKRLSAHLPAFVVRASGVLSVGAGIFLAAQSLGVDFTRPVPPEPPRVNARACNHDTFATFPTSRGLEHGAVKRIGKSACHGSHGVLGVGQDDAS